MSVLKEQGWATSLSTGIGEDGEADASTHALFGLQIDLSKCGMGRWEKAVTVVFAYLVMLEFHFLKGPGGDNKTQHEGKKKEGLAPWIHDELKSIAELSFRYADEGEQHTHHHVICILLCVLISSPVVILCSVHRRCHGYCQRGGRKYGTLAQLSRRYVHLFLPLLIFLNSVADKNVIHQR